MKLSDLFKTDSLLSIIDSQGERIVMLCKTFWHFWHSFYESKHVTGIFGIISLKWKKAFDVRFLKSLFEDLFCFITYCLCLVWPKLRKYKKCLLWCQNTQRWLWISMQSRHFQCQRSAVQSKSLAKFHAEHTLILNCWKLRK